jgi:hypothetical protein
MQANSFFLQRAVARSADWQLRYPALSLASATDLVDEPRRQIVVAAVNHDRIRMVFFSSLGLRARSADHVDRPLGRSALVRLRPSLEPVVVARFGIARNIRSFDTRAYRRAAR